MLVVLAFMNEDTGVVVAIFLSDANNLSEVTLVKSSNYIDVYPRLVPVEKSGNTNRSVDYHLSLFPEVMIIEDSVAQFSGRCAEIAYTVLNFKCGLLG